MEENKNKKELKTERQEKRKSTQKIKGIIVWAVVLGAIGYGVFWIATLPKLPQSEIITRNGFHWHPSISITINGEKVKIPANIGIGGAVHSPMHTHKSDGIIHSEFSGIVRENDIHVSNFFDIWGEDFNSESIMGNMVGEGGGTLKMLVNGKENMEFENYMMKDGDKIEIIYEI